MGHSFAKIPAMISAVLLGIVSVPAIAETKPTVVLDDFIKFTDPEACLFAGEFKIMFDNLWKNGADPEGPPVFSRLVVPASLAVGFYEPVIVSDEAGSNVSISVEGVWLGLKIYEISSFAPAGGDPPSLSIAFEEDEAVVREKFETIGIYVNENGHSIVDPDDSVYGFYTYIVADYTNPKTTHYSCLIL